MGVRCREGGGHLSSDVLCAAGRRSALSGSSNTVLFFGFVSRTQRLVNVAKMDAQARAFQFLGSLVLLAASGEWFVISWAV